MWMVKIYANDSGFSPNMLIDVVQRFHNNLDKIHPALLSDMGFYSASKVATSPKDIDSYPDYRTLKRIVEAAEESVTRKQKEEKAKSGADKIYEDNRWLVINPKTLESSCYYGAGTKWCTTTKDTSHFKDYSAKGPLYYIIDKTRQLGRFYKIAMHVTWDGDEEYYDEEDNRLEDNVLDAIKALLPHRLQQTIFDNWEDTGKPEKEMMSLDKFRDLLEKYVSTTKSQRTLKTNSGIWKLHISEGIWYWFSTPNEPNDYIEVQATPFHNNLMEFPFDSDDIKNIDSPDPWSLTFGADFGRIAHFGPDEYLDTAPSGWQTIEGNVKIFLNNIYRPLVKKVLDGKEVQEAVGSTYTTWDAESYVSSYAFKYPPRMGTMTQKFTDYLQENPRRTANQFYEDVLGYSRPRGHNNMFFASIKDSGIVKMERQGRQFVYSLGPNYDDWTRGKLLRTGGRHN